PTSNGLSMRGGPRRRGRHVERAEELQKRQQLHAWQRQQPSRERQRRWRGRQEPTGQQRRAERPQGQERRRAQQ
ncbi:MAG: hypothetical protein ACRES1_04130, partial [Steroidobacteraceae bacterium]